MVFLYNPKQLKCTAEMLAATAKAARDFYYAYLEFWSKDSIPDYTEELNDWLLWLEIIDELQSRILPASNYIRHVIPPATRNYFPRPSQLLDDNLVKISAKGLKEDEEMVYINFVRASQDILLVLGSFDPAEQRQRYPELENLSDKELLAQELLRYANSFECRQYQGTDLELYMVAHHFGIQDLICTDGLFSAAVMKYYPLRNVYRRTELELDHFFKVFEPIAKQAYMALTDTSQLDFDEIAELMTKKYPSISI